MDLTVENIIQQQLKLIKNHIKCIPNYPKKGVLFRDISTLLKNPHAYSASIKLFANYYKNFHFTKIVGVESRGFFFSAPLALVLQLGFIPARKEGRLPCNTIKEKYVLEYGTGCLEMHDDSISSEDKVLIVDDLLATGGTIEAVTKLIRRLGGEVQNAAFLIDLKNLGGQLLLKKIGINAYSLIEFSDSV